MSSIQDTFKKLLAQPGYPDAASASFLRNELKNYPFCQSLQLSYAKYCHQFISEEAEAQLGLAAIYAPDRTVLFNLINFSSPTEEKETVPIEAPLPPAEDAVQQPLTEEVVPVAAAPLPIETPLPPAEEAVQQPLTEEVVPVATAPLPIETPLPPAEEAVQQPLTEEVVPVAAAPLPIATPLPPDDNVGSKLQAEVSEPLQETTGRSLKTDRPAYNLHYEDIPIRKTFLYWLKKTQKGYFLNSRNEMSMRSSFSQSEVDMENSTRPLTNKLYSDENSSIRLDEQVEINKIMEVETLEKNYQANIFHLQQVGVANLTQTVEFDLRKNEDRIIEKFLRDKVQKIQPSREREEPAPDSSVEKLVERASSDLGIVSETLADIYRRQQYFDKAINAYLELSLKLPKKSAYFASLIEEIRKEASQE